MKKNTVIHQLESAEDRVIGRYHFGEINNCPISEFNCFLKLIHLLKDIKYDWLNFTTQS